jgi:hypothetical protein
MRRGIQNRVGMTVNALYPADRRGNVPRTECIGLNDHLVNVVAFRALKRVEVETHACGHNARLASCEYGTFGK